MSNVAAVDMSNVAAVDMSNVAAVDMSNVAADDMSNVAAVDMFCLMLQLLICLMLQLLICLMLQLLICLMLQLLICLMLQLLICSVVQLIGHVLPARSAATRMPPRVIILASHAALCATARATVCMVRMRCRTVPYGRARLASSGAPTVSVLTCAGTATATTIAATSLMNQATAVSFWEHFIYLQNMQRLYLTERLCSLRGHAESAVVCVALIV